MGELPASNDFDKFSMLLLDEEGRFRDSRLGIITPDLMMTYFRRKIVLSNHTTDIFVWVHGWQNDHQRAIATARQLFGNLDRLFKSRAEQSNGREVVPAFVAVHWPSMSSPGPLGYTRIRNRAKEMTTEGEAEFFLASLLGYLDAGNERGPDRKVLRSRGGHYLHCLGHSFGGRFLAAAIKGAATPTERTRKILAAAKRKTEFQFTVDSLCVFQMAAPSTAFAAEFTALLQEAPLSGPIVLTFSRGDRALCLWHLLSEGQRGIGCRGARKPADRIGSINVRDAATPYLDSDFAKDITNVDCSRLFRRGGLAEGGHSDLWHPETYHLIASVVDQMS